MSDETGCQDSIFQSMTIGEIIARLTLEEKVAMMSGSGFYSIHAESKKWGAKPYPAGGANECGGPFVAALWPCCDRFVTAL